MGILQLEKFSPFVFVGLGGSGNKVVDRVARKLKNHPFHDRIRDLVHFVAIDTNKNDLNRNAYIPEENRFLISSFDRSTYVERKRGRFELEEDQLVTQWIPDDYTFREGATPGAGQIRIESRLSLYYNLEDDRAKMIKKFRRILDDATKPDVPWREERDRVVNIMLYGSAAGGTGSGSFVTMAYLLRQLVHEHGWGRAKVVGNLMLPSLFYNVVEQVLQRDINANAYAALKEIEHLTRLGYPGRQRNETFHYNPLSRRSTSVEERPFALLYLVDKPAELTVANQVDALADSSFLQVFSPLIGQQEGEYDNYEKHQKQLALGHFTVHYGSYGAAVLHFPRQDLLTYSRLRYVARAFDKYLNFGDDPRFAVDWEDKRFQLLNEVKRNALIDEKYSLWIAHKADLERDEELEGVFTEIHEQKTPKGDPLAEAFRAKLFAIWEGLDPLIEIESLDPTQVNENQTSLQRPLSQMRREVNDSRSRVMERLHSVNADVSSGRLFSEFFRTNDVNPLAQRYMLIALSRQKWRTEDGRDQPQIGPFEDPAETSGLFDRKEPTASLDAENVTQSIKDVEQALAASADRGFRFGENKRFLAAKRQARELFDELAEDNRDWLKVYFWQRFHEELQNEIKSRLTAFRNVARISADEVKGLKGRATAFMADPGSVDPDAQSAAYHLDLEVLRDDRAGKRLWDRFFRHRFDRAENFDDKEVFQIITKAFAPAQEDGRVRAKDAREIVADIRKGLDREAARTFERALADMHDMHLAGALELEARYSLTDPDVVKDEELNAVPMERVEERMRDKIRRAVNSAVVLANLDRTKFDDPTVTPNQSAYVGVHPRYRGESRLSLEKMLLDADDGLELVDGWGEEDLIVLYRAVLGIPLYFYSRVAKDYREDYIRAHADPNRTYPLHIDKNFEDLPNLDPIEIQEAEARRRREEEAAQHLAVRQEALWGFSLAGMAGTIARSEASDGYVLSRGGRSKELARRRCEAFEAFGKLPEQFQKDVLEGAATLIKRADAGRKEREKVLGELRAWSQRLSDLYNDAMFDDDEIEMKFLEEEREVLEARIAGLAG
jgi:hypothetical protein